MKTISQKEKRRGKDYGNGLREMRKRDLRDSGRKKQSGQCGALHHQASAGHCRQREDRHEEAGEYRWGERCLQ